MNVFKKPSFINPSISPNVESDDIRIALYNIVFPINLKSGEYIQKVEKWFKDKFDCRNVYTFESGRKAQYILLKALRIKPSDEILVQAFTCVAVIDPAIWLGAKPVYVDINRNTLSMDIEDLKRKINKNTKAIIVQHTFGIPSEIDKIKKIAKENNIFLIEDCAHVIGSTYKGIKLGKWGDAAFFSFGRDKIISSVYGGIIMFDDNRLNQKVEKICENMQYPNAAWIYQQLLHPLMTKFTIKLFGFNKQIGNTFLLLIKKLGLLSLAVRKEEKSPKQSDIIVKKYPNALAQICFSQLQRLERFNETRLNIYQTYKFELKQCLDKIEFPSEEQPYLRIPIFVKEKRDLINYCKKSSVYLGDWYSNIIDPKGVELAQIGYKIGLCKNAEEVSSEIVNLPCYPTMKIKEVIKVSDMIKKYYKV